MRALPWEYLYDETRGFLALSVHTPVVRYLPAAHKSSLVVAPPLRVLVVMAGPEGYPPLAIGSATLARWSIRLTTLPPMDA